MKVYLMGRHAHRTPFAYPIYKNLFDGKIEFVNNPLNAEVIIFAYIINIDENAEVLRELLKKKPSLKLVVFSEEPLWDTTNSGNFKLSQVERKVENDIFHCKVINHVTTDVYSFNKFPYFITTSDDYYLRYMHAFKRNASLTKEEILNIWQKSEYKYAFFAENRDLVKKYSVKHPDVNVYGLSVYRTNIAKKIQEKVGNDSCLCVGRGWQKVDSERQKLVDWHMDKLSLLTYSSFVLSSLENTVQQNYISEKIFDSYAALGLPIYWADEKHALFKILNKDATFINIVGLDEAQAIDEILAIKPSLDLAERYLATQKRLADYFGNMDEFVQARLEFVTNFMEALLQVKKH